MQGNFVTFVASCAEFIMKSFVAFLEHGGVQVDPPSWDCSAARCACCAIERGYAGAWFEALVAKHVGALLVRLHDRDDGALVPARTSEVTKRKPCRQSSQTNPRCMPLSTCSKCENITSGRGQGRRPCSASWRGRQTWWPPRRGAEGS